MWLLLGLRIELELGIWPGIGLGLGLTCAQSFHIGFFILPYRLKAWPFHFPYITLLCFGKAVDYGTHKKWVIVKARLRVRVRVRLMVKFWVRGYICSESHIGSRYCPGYSVPYIDLL